MNSKDLNGLIVLSINDGQRLGTVNRTYVDGPAKQIAGFSFTESGGFMQVESEPKLDTSDVRSVGPDALTIEDRSAVRAVRLNEQYADLLVLEKVSQLPVLTEGGSSVGHVVSVEFDPHSYALTGLEVSSGRFKVNRSIQIDHVITIGRDYIIVDEGLVHLTIPHDEAAGSTTAQAV